MTSIVLAVDEQDVVDTEGETHRRIVWLYRKGLNTRRRRNMRRMEKRKRTDCWVGSGGGWMRTWW